MAAHRILALALLLAPAVAAYLLHRRMPVSVRVAAVFAGLLQGPFCLAVVAIPDRDMRAGSFVFGVVGLVVYGFVRAIVHQRQVLAELKNDAPPSIPEQAYEPAPVVERRADPAPEPVPEQVPEPVTVAPVTVIPERPAAVPDELVAAGWPGAQPEPEPIPQPAKAEAAPLPAKRGRGRPRKAAAKLASPSPVVQSEPVAPVDPAPVSRSADIEAAAADAIAQAVLAPPAQPVAVPIARPWRRPVVHAVPPEPFELPPPPAPVPEPIAARAALIEAVEDAPQRPTHSVLERLLTRPAVIDSVSPSGAVRIRIVGWPARILTAYRALQLSALASVMLFYDSIFEWLGARMVMHTGPLMKGALKEALGLSW